MELTGKRILVTGGAGFIGSHIVDQLLLEDVASITAIDNLTRGHRSNLADALPTNRVRLVQCDICNQETLSNLASEADVVFHQAALRITQCAEEPRAAVDTMAYATFRLFELCVAQKVRKVVFASSASIYGLAEHFPTAENHHPYNDRTLYGSLKSFSESLLRSFNDMYGLRYVALRYFNVYGTRMDMRGRYTEVLIRWMERIRAGLPPIIFGDGSQTMDFVNVRDVARANILAAKSDTNEEVFNVASSREVSLLELAELLLDAMGSSMKPEFAAERVINAVQRRIADTSKAREHLGFEAQTSLESGLRELISWWELERERGTSETTT